MQTIVKVLTATRTMTLNEVKELTPEQWFEIPAGFHNNIAWNVGHLIFATDGLIYKRGGLAGHVGADYAQRYANGTSPSDWDSQPDIEELMAQLVAQPAQLAADVEAGMFEGDYPTWSLGPVPINSFMEIAVYNAQHEGWHRGVMESIRGALSN